MNRILCIDYGTVRIGLARSDPTQTIAQPWKIVLAGKTAQESAQAIAAALEEPVEKIVLGLPLHLSGKESPMSLAVRELAKALEALLAVPVVLWDERLTSAEIERTLKDGGLKRKQRAALSDTLAATLILQGYLESLVPVSSTLRNGKSLFW